MPFNVGDIVRIQNTNCVRPAFARVQQVLSRTVAIQDFQEYIVEFMNCRSERFRYGLCREFEMRLSSFSDSFDEQAFH